MRIYNRAAGAITADEIRESLDRAAIEDKIENIEDIALRIERKLDQALEGLSGERDGNE